MKFDLVVTRHTGLIEFLKFQDLLSDTCEIISHVSDPEILVGKNVIGVLPHNLSCLCESFSEISLNLPAELRGKELSFEQVNQYQTGIASYTVSKFIG